MHRNPFEMFNVVVGVLSALPCVIVGIVGLSRETPSWRGLTAASGAMLVGLLVAVGIDVEIDVRRDAAAEGWDLRPVVVAADHLAAGTAITFDEVSQRPMPEQFITDSVVTPFDANAIIGKRVVGGMEAGDPLTWTSVGLAGKPPNPVPGSDRFAASHRSGRFSMTNMGIEVALLCILIASALIASGAYLTVKHHPLPSSRLPVAIALGGAAAGLLVLALALAELVVAKSRREVRAGWNLVPVLVASRDLAAGTMLTSDVVTDRPIPEQWVTASVFEHDRRNQALGRALMGPVKRGEPISNLLVGLSSDKPAPR